MATLSAPSPNSITASFPIPSLEPITARPTYASVQALQVALNSNAASVHSDLGDGLQGHLALTISAAAYLVITGVAFVAPANPGPHPGHADNATQFMITETNR